MLDDCESRSFKCCLIGGLQKGYLDDFIVITTTTTNYTNSIVCRNHVAIVIIIKQRGKHFLQISRSRFPNKITNLSMFYSIIFAIPCFKIIEVGNLCQCTSTYCNIKNHSSAGLKLTMLSKYLKLNTIGIQNYKQYLPKITKVKYNELSYQSSVQILFIQRF